jgi:chemotaxis protein methyltransferase CheR
VTGDQDCTAFLQWALPRLRMRWGGFRKVRGQVCKRLGRRLRELDLSDLVAYQDYLERHPDEWAVLDGFCRITISRFHRDRRVFEHLRDRLLPELCAGRRDRVTIRCWSAGCASGEEPYTVSIIWNLELRHRYPGVSLEIVATDTEPRVLERARAAEYPASSLRELTPFWREEAFEPRESGWRLREQFRNGVSFYRADIREEMPDGPFDLPSCKWRLWRVSWGAWLPMERW